MIGDDKHCETLFSMNLSPVSLNDDEEGNENVTIELYHTIALSNGPDEQNHQKDDTGRTQSFLSHIARFMCCCRCCKRGQNFEPLRSNEIRP